MTRSTQPGPGAALAIGLMFVAVGVLPMLAAFDVGPLRREDINGPPWLALAAGGAFAMAGCAIIAGPQAPLLSRLFGTLALAALAALGNWIAFGAGERVCSGGVSLGLAWSRGDFAGLACRIPFGLGALVVDAFLCWGVVSLLEKVLGGSPALVRMRKGTEWLILASVLPILLPLLLLGLLGAVLGAIRTRLVTGTWPRNEAFIARQKAKILMRGRGPKPPDESG